MRRVGLSVSTRAHPRSRGEHLVPCAGGPFVLGSSPLARGTRGGGEGDGGVVGLIPARAGNTRLGNERPRPVGAHPRSRGEHRYWELITPNILGSSPLARGTRLFYDRVMEKNGLIPARAGNTAAG